MENDAEFDFIYLPEKESFVKKKSIKDHLTKWAMKGSLKVHYYNFNQPFKTHQKDEFVNDFFRSPEVYMSLQVLKSDDWAVVGEAAERVEIEVVPCSVRSMGFFDPLSDPANRIVRKDRKSILQRFEEKIDDFYVSDNLRVCLLSEDSREGKLFTKGEREEFLFKLLTHFSLGGSWCQFEDVLDPYLEVTKEVYMDLISVERDENNELNIRSLVLKVVAYGPDDSAICPTEPSNIQNFAYLIIDPFKRQVIALINQYCAPLATE